MTAFVLRSYLSLPTDEEKLRLAVLSAETDVKGAEAEIRKANAEIQVKIRDGSSQSAPIAPIPPST